MMENLSLPNDNSLLLNTGEPGRKRTYSVFRFIGDALAFDLINTEIRTMSGKYLDLLGDPADLERWWREALTHHPEIASRADFEGLTEIKAGEALLVTTKRLRQELRNLFSCLIDQQPLKLDDLSEINNILRNNHQQLLPSPNSQVTLVYRAEAGQNNHFLLAIVLSSLKLVTESQQERWRKCKNERCIMLFYDQTKSATRHWCNVQCKDRARAAQRYRQTKV